MRNEETLQECFAAFLPVVQQWFNEDVGQPSEPQQRGWPEIAAGKNVLICAPTGSGKTLAAFLNCLDRIYKDKKPGTRNQGIRVVYISPLKALNNDIYRNLEIPLEGIREKAGELGIELPDIEVAVRTGDTSQKERNRMLRNPPDILITTPESLFIMLTAIHTRQLFSTVEQVIVDEIHSICANKRGVHLALSLERLQRLCGGRLQRIGLSATIHPLEEAAGFLAGQEKIQDEEGNLQFRPRPVTLIHCDGKRVMDLTVSVPVQDMRSLPDGSIWPKIYHRLLMLVKSHKSTLIFVNNRRLAEQVASGMNSLAEESFVKTHHGSVAREIRHELEKQLKEEKLSCLVATSTLELGIDIGNIELVVQVGSPGSVSQTLQRIGRAGHQVDAVSKGIILPKTRGDLLEAAFIAYRTKIYDIEETKVPQNCLDILSQQLVSIACEGAIGLQEAYELVKGAYPYHQLPFKQFRQVVEMLGDPSPPEEPGLIKPRLFFDPIHNTLTGNTTGRAMCLNCGGTIPDKGYYPVYVKNSELKLGELEEEFVFESRIGERFLLGSSVWRLDRIESSRVIVSPSQDPGAKLPFWKGDEILRPYEIGVRFGHFLGILQARMETGDFITWVCQNCGLDETAAQNLMDYVSDQIRETGGLYSGRRVICEYFSDEVGDRRMILHSPFGGSIHAPLAMLLHQKLSSALHCDIEYVYGDNGILFHFMGYSGSLNNPLSLMGKGEVETEIMAMLPEAPMFNLNMRYNLGRSLLLSSRGFGRRKPLWIQRLRSAELVQSLSNMTDHPIFLETFRECLQDRMDLAGLQRVLQEIAEGTIRVSEVVTQKPSPFSAELLFTFWQAFQYTDELPLAERRNQLLVTDRSFIQLAAGVNAEYELLDPRAVRMVEKELLKSRYGTKISHEDELHSFLHIHGELSAVPGRNDAFKELSPETELELLNRLEEQGRAVRVMLGHEGQPYWIAAEDLPLYDRISTSCRRMTESSNKDSIAGVSIPLEASEANTSSEAVEAAVRVLRRYIRFSPPFGAEKLAARYGIDYSLLSEALARLETHNEILRIREADNMAETVFCHQKVYERIKKKTLALARQEIKPREEPVYASFLMAYQEIGEDVLPAEDKLAGVLQKLKGLFLPAVWWEDFILPVRVEGYEPRMLDYLCATGAVRWLARTRSSTREIAFLPAEEEQAGFLLQEAAELKDFEKLVQETLQRKGACFLKEFAKELNLPPQELLDKVEEMVWRGLLTNDSFSLIRYYLDKEKKNSPWTRYNTYPSMGRWSLTEVCGGKRDVQGLMQYILQLLDRYGIVTREVTDCEKCGYKWSDVYTCLKTNEFSSGIKRGLYVSGMSGLQFARDGELEQMRMEETRETEQYVTLVSCDPANPYKDIFAKNTSWKTGRNQGTAVVMKNGKPVLLVKEYGGCLVPLEQDPFIMDKAIRNFVDAYSCKRIWISRKNLFTEFWGEDRQHVEDSPVYSLLLSVGYNREYKGATLWRKAN